MRRRFDIPFVRSALPFRLEVLEGIEGCGPVWSSLGSQPWFEIDCARKVSNCWLRLTWRSSLVERPSRPILRFQGPFGTQDHYLPAAVFGQQSWIGHAPKGTEKVLLSPVGLKGPFGFELIALERLSLAAMLGLAYRRNIPRALLASLTTLIQMPAAARINLSVAVRGRALSHYDRWLRECSRPLETQGIDVLERGRGPHIRFLVLGRIGRPNGQPELSLRSQPYTNWSVTRLTLSASTHPGEIGRIIEQDPSLIGTMDNDDFVVAVPEGAVVAPNALPALAHAAVRSPETQAFYGDQDRLSEDGRHSQPQFHMRYDPLLAAVGYYRSVPLFYRVGGLRKGSAEGWVDTQPLSRLLFSYPEAPARSLVAKPLAALSPPATPAPDLVSIIIPTRDRHALLSKCIESILKSTEHWFEIIIVDNRTTDIKALHYMKEASKDHRVSIVRDDGEFNFSHLSNKGAKLAKGDYLLFLNNDVIVDDPQWIKSMKVHACQPRTGAVGMKLLYESGRLQHVGAVAGLTGIVGHIDVGLRQDDLGLFERNGVDHEISAVTGACLMIRKDLFWHIGGFNEHKFPVEYNDIDLCYRLLKRGYRNVVVCTCTITHLESRSRGKTAVNAYTLERKTLIERWPEYMRQDPYYHPALSLVSHVPRLG